MSRKRRAAVAIVQGDQVALIERHRDDLRYFLFPGGSVEPGERPEETAVREAREELGLAVTLGPHIATVWFGESEQLYFAADRGGGTFGTGTGDEMSGRDVEGHGSYVPVWVELDRLDALDVRPRLVADLIRSSRANGWPAEAVVSREG